MADRIEREIEEILARLDEGTPGRGERKPASIIAHREKARAGGPARRPRSSWKARITPPSMLLTGAALVVGGLLVSSFWGPLIWISFVGVFLFVAAFAWSFRRTPPGGAGSAPQGRYWRDRYIEYEPSHPSTWDRLKRRVRGR
jgi:hypothetical protein